MDKEKHINQLSDIKTVDEEDLYLFNHFVKDNPECWETLDEKEQSVFEQEAGILKPKIG